LSTPAETTGPHDVRPLARRIGIPGNLGITLSFLTPTASVFITAAVLISVRGSGSFLSFVVAGVGDLAIALCFAELGAAIPRAGGHYSIVARVLGKPLGFVAFVLLAVDVFLIVSASALGVAQYLSVISSHLNQHVVGTVVIVVAALVAVLGIRLNAFVTGAFLALELLGIGAVVVIGFTHVHQSGSILVHPVATGADGVLHSVGLGGILAGTAIAIFAYDGYETAVVFSEETRAPRSAIGRAVLTALLVAVVAELLPVSATLLGAKSLPALQGASSPFLQMVRDDAGTAARTTVSLIVAVAIFNAVIAAVLVLARIVYSSGRDTAWPLPISRFLSAIHPRLRTPWAATLVLGGICAVVTAVSTIAAIVTFTSVVLLVLLGLVVVAALVSRVTQRELERPWRMPIWPVPPLVALAFIALSLSKQTLHDVGIVAAIVGGTAIYWLLYLRPRSDRWVMRAPAADET
jgi:amino acid transporter